jgi:AAA ATPase domain
MKLTEIRVRNFRSIEAEQHFQIPGKMTLVGPNNSGKTNLLKAVQVLFTGQANKYGYSRDNDLTFGVGRARTSISALFDGNAQTDKEIYDLVDELHALQGTQRSGTQLTLTLYFTDTNTPVYSFFPNIKRPTAKTKATQFSRTHIALVNLLLGKFSLHYVPSAKSVDQIYHDLLTPFLRQKVSEVIVPHLSEIDRTLSEAANALNKELRAAQLSEYEASFTLPGQSVEALVSGFDFMISDPQKTPIHEKGMGIQTTALLAAFRWITKQETNVGKEVIWLLEEPESYLHPNLASHCNSILENLSEDASVLKTTHSMAFVPQDPRFVSGTRLNSKNKTEIEKYKTFSEAVTTIRSALGIKFSDFYNLDQFNVFVEGPSDREIFVSVLDQIPVEDYPLSCLRRAKFEDFGGVSHLAGFLRATYQFIRKEYASIAIFDGDDAGDKARRELQHYFNNCEIPFEANRHYVSVRSKFAIEGLFPDEWIKGLYAEHPGWFDTYSVDATDQLEPFKIKDGSKSNVQNKLLALAQNEQNIAWADRFLAVMSAADKALNDQQKSLKKSS